MKEWLMGSEDGTNWILVDADSAGWHANTRPCKKNEPTIEQVANWMDELAENANAHDFVMTHRALAVLLSERCGKKMAREIMLDLADWDGLPGMTGVCGLGPEDGQFSRQFGVPIDSWEEWKIK